MSFSVGRTKITVSPLFFILITAMILLDRTGLILITLISSLLHESGHLAAMRICKQPPLALNITPCGLEIVRGLSSDSHETVWIALSGPFANMLAVIVMLVIAQKYPSVTLLYAIAVNALIVLLNCLPLRGLDGGELAYLFMQKRWGMQGERLFSIMSYTVSVLLLSVGIATLICTRNFTLALVGVYLVLLNLFKL